MEAGLTALLRREQREPAAGLPGIDALDRILAVAGYPTRRRVPVRLEHAGLALLLIITQPTAAWTLHREYWPHVDGYICTIAEAFAEALGQPAGAPFWRGAALAGLRTLLGRNLAITQDNSGFAAELRITNPDAALTRVAVFLHRRKIRAEPAAAAFDALVTIYRRHSPWLASFRSGGGEFPARTPRLRQRLADMLLHKEEMTR